MISLVAYFKEENNSYCIEEGIRQQQTAAAWEVGTAVVFYDVN